MPDPQVLDMPERSRYEVRVGDETAGHLTYHDSDGARVLTHTVIGDAFGGRGLGSALVRGALDDIRGRRRTVVPVCTFVQRFLDRHADLRDLVADDAPPTRRE